MKKIISKKDVMSFWKGKSKKITAVDCFQWFTNQAELKPVADNLTRLAICYDLGIGTKKDLKKANLYYLKAAKLNDEVAQYNIAFSYREGDGVRKNYKKAFHWMSKSASQGYAEACSDLGHMYYYGIGTKKNLIKAANFYKIAAKKKLDRALYNLGLMYFNNEAGNGSLKTSRRYFEKAASLGNVASKRFLKKHKSDFSGK